VPRKRPQPLPPPSPFKDFFKHSETIFIARCTALIGFTTAVLGALDWSPLLSMNLDTGFNRKQVIWLGMIMIFQGIATEVARRRNAQFN